MLTMLCQVLKGKSCVTELLVSDNNITEEGAGALAQIVSTLHDHIAVLTRMAGTQLSLIHISEPTRPY